MTTFLEQLFVRQWKWFLLLLFILVLIVGMNLNTFSTKYFVSEVIIEFRSLGKRTKLNPESDKMSFLEGFFDQDVRSSSIWYSTLSKSPEIINSLIPAIREKLPDLTHAKLRNLMKVEWIRRTPGLRLKIAHPNISTATFIVNRWAKVFVKYVSEKRRKEIGLSIKEVKELLIPAERKLASLIKEKLSIENKSTLTTINDLVFQKNNAFASIYSLHDKLNDIVALPRTFLFSLERDFSLLGEWIVLFDEYLKEETKRKRVSKWGTDKRRRIIVEDLNLLKKEYRNLIVKIKKLEPLQAFPDFDLLTLRLKKLVSSLDPIILRNNLILSKIRKENLFYLEGLLVAFFRNQVNSVTFKDLVKITNVKFQRLPEKILKSESLSRDLRDGIVRVENIKVKKENLLEKIAKLQRETVKISNMRVNLEKLEDSIELQKRLVTPLTEQMNELLVEKKMTSGSAKIESLASEYLSKEMVRKNLLKLFAISLIILLVGFSIIVIKDRSRNFSREK
tara:strand:+ start:14030 stop:15547 length:1518 start_codon:yes stop_codon:yes gene_type:complete